MTLIFDNLDDLQLTDLQDARGWQNQFRILSTWGKRITTKTSLRSDGNRVRGCEVAAWLAYQKIDQQHFFAFDSDSRLINGLAVLVLLQVQGLTTAQLEQLDLNRSLTELGITKHLSPSRNNGLKAVMDRIFAYVNSN